MGIHGQSIRVNRLIAQAFIPNPLALPESQHKDGNRHNNTVENLKWGTQKDNAQDRRLHGNTVVGEKSPNAKLSKMQVHEMRTLRNTGYTLARLAEVFGVSKKLVLLIVNHKIWRSV